LFLENGSSLLRNISLFAPQRLRSTPKRNRRNNTRRIERPINLLIDRLFLLASSPIFKCSLHTFLFSSNSLNALFPSSTFLSISSSNLSNSFSTFSCKLRSVSSLSFSLLSSSSFFTLALSSSCTFSLAALSSSSLLLLAINSSYSLFLSASSSSSSLLLCSCNSLASFSLWICSSFNASSCACLSSAILVSRSVDKRSSSASWDAVSESDWMQAWMSSMLEWSLTTRSATAVLGSPILPSPSLLLSRCVCSRVGQEIFLEVIKNPLFETQSKQETRTLRFFPPSKQR
jgi:hypothetical protein